MKIQVPQTIRGAVLLSPRPAGRTCSSSRCFSLSIVCFRSFPPPSCSYVGTHCPDLVVVGFFQLQEHPSLSLLESQADGGSLKCVPNKQATSCVGAIQPIPLVRLKVVGSWYCSNSNKIGMISRSLMFSISRQTRSITAPPPLLPPMLSCLLWFHLDAKYC